jgi:hypothetical protein
MTRWDLRLSWRLLSCCCRGLGFWCHVYLQFTMETEMDGHIPFVDIDVYRKPASSLRHRVYRKHTNTNLYLNTTSHHHLDNKQVVLSTLDLCAKAVCDTESPTGIKIIAGNLQKQWLRRKTNSPCSQSTYDSLATTWRPYLGGVLTIRWYHLQ